MFLVFVAVSDLVRILQFAGAAHDESRIKRDLHVEVAPYAVEFPGHILVRMPSEVIVFRQLRVPLCHGVRDALAVVAAGAADLDRNLRFELHLENGLRFRKKRTRQCDLEDSAFRMM